MVSKKETKSHCHLKTQTVSYLKSSSTDQTKIIREQLENTSQKLDKSISLLK
jgi:hypothetical protein